MQLAVEAIGRGVQAPVVEVEAGMGAGDCGFDFKAGQRYVVYAYRNRMARRSRPAPIRLVLTTR